MRTRTIQAVDVGPRYGPYRVKAGLTSKLISGGSNVVVRRARLANKAYPAMEKGSAVIAAEIAIACSVAQDSIPARMTKPHRENTHE